MAWNNNDEHQKNITKNSFVNYIVYRGVSSSFDAQNGCKKIELDSISCMILVLIALSL